MNLDRKPSGLHIEVVEDREMGEALDFLRSSAIEPESSTRLEIDVIRAWRDQSRRRAWSYWLPGAMGGLVGGLAVFALAQLFLGPPPASKIDGGPSVENVIDPLARP